MILKKFKALSLTELLIVLVIIAILFAAMAPIVTKRHKGDAISNGYIWNYVSFDDEYDAFFDPGVKNWTSSVFVDADPSISDSNGKLILNPSDVTEGSKTYSQHQMQFRYGSGRGNNTANLLVKDDNIIFGPDSSLYTKNGTTAMGSGVMYIRPNQLSTYQIEKAVAFGDHALGETWVSGDISKLIAVGANAGRNYNSSGSHETIYVGANAGRDLRRADGTIAIGANTPSTPVDFLENSVYITSYPDYVSSKGSFLQGNSVGSTGQFPVELDGNTIIGTSYIGYGNNNTIIGYGAYANGDPTINKMVAIGYGACDSISNRSYYNVYGAHDGSSICIGHNSAKTYNNTPDSFQSDDDEHIYIGGTPLEPVRREF